MTLVVKDEKMTRRE